MGACVRGTDGRTERMTDGRTVGRLRGRAGARTLGHAVIVITIKTKSNISNSHNKLIPGEGSEMGMAARMRVAQSLMILCLLTFSIYLIFVNRPRADGRSPASAGAAPEAR